MEKGKANEVELERLFDLFLCECTHSRVVVQLAALMKDWAVQRGATGLAHWFSPVRGSIHGFKMDSFVSIDFKTHRLISDFSGSELFQGETDGSSFPNGGVRATHRAAAYMGWETERFAARREEMREISRPLLTPLCVSLSVCV
jgi:glutamine synthetase